MPSWFSSRKAPPPNCVGLSLYADGFSCCVVDRAANKLVSAHFQSLTQNEGSVDVALPVSSNWPWLQFDWNGDGTLDANATATASFGTYRGSDRVIYWRE